MPRERAEGHPSMMRDLWTWVALLALTTLSFGASYLPTGAFELPIALAFAVAKSGLVLAYFMHLVEQRIVDALPLIVALSLVVMLLALVGVDVATRRTFPRAPLHDLVPGPPEEGPPPPGGAGGTVPWPPPTARRAP